MTGAAVSEPGRGSLAALCGLSTLIVIVVAALSAPLIAPQDVNDPASIELWNSELPPVWADGGTWSFPLGTDLQGRDLFSALLYGTRLSLGIALAATLIPALTGLLLGMLAGIRGGRIELVILFLCDIALSVPSLFSAALIAALLRGGSGGLLTTSGAALVIICAISLSAWVAPAQASRAGARIACGRDYVMAARLIGTPGWRITLFHILPNCLGPVMVAVTLGFGSAVLTEATLSFLGIGLSADQASLGALIRMGYEEILSGKWWLAVFPVAVLTLLVVAVNLIADWLGAWLNPRQGNGDGGATG